MAREWFEAGIPLGVVLAAVSELFDERESASKVLTLKACSRRVHKRWSELALLGTIVSPGTPVAPGASCRAVLERLATSLPLDLPDRNRWANRIQAIEDGELGAVEEWLQRLETELLDGLEHHLSDPGRLALDSAVDRALARLGRTLDTRAAEEARRTLRRQELRRRFGVPRLSVVE